MLLKGLGSAAAGFVALVLLLSLCEGQRIAPLQAKESFLAFKKAQTAKLDAARQLIALNQNELGLQVDQQEQAEIPSWVPPSSPFCTNRTNCGNYSCDLFEYNNDFISLLMDYGGVPGFDEFYHHMGKAVEILRSYGGVVTDDYYFPHMTVQYMCCYTPFQYETIISVINNYSWQPFNLTFDRVVCNNGGDGFSGLISFIILLDQPSQDRMFAFIKGLENVLAANGVQIHRPRAQQELFHSTLGVTFGNYPVAKALDQISKEIPVFNTIPMTIDSYWSFLPPNQFKAKK